MAISRLSLIALSVLLLTGCNLITPKKDVAASVAQSQSGTRNDLQEVAARVKPPEKQSPPAVAAPPPHSEPVTETKAATATLMATKQQPNKTSLIITGVRPATGPATNVAAEPQPVSIQALPKHSTAEKPGSIVLSGPQTVYPTQNRKARLSGGSWWMFAVVAFLLLCMAAFAVRPVRTRLKDLFAQVSSHLRRLRKRDEDGFEDGKLMLEVPKVSGTKKDRLGDSIEDTVLEA